MQLNLEMLVNKVLEGMSTKTVVGEPMQIDGVTLIPIVNVSFGFGGGGGSGDGPGGKDAGSGAGGGGGARMKVAGVLVVKDGDVKFVQTGKGGGIDRLLDSIPDLLEMVKVKAEEAKEDESGD
ncbi:MAG: sporulation protein [Firmicutes bacterium]|nr:sporulation protein [Bacillota bacterium]